MYSWTTFKRLAALCLGINMVAPWISPIAMIIAILTPFVHFIFVFAWVASNRISKSKADLDGESYDWDPKAADKFTAAAFFLIVLSFLAGLCSYVLADAYAT